MPVRPSTYVHGTSPEEQERLKLLNRLLNESSLNLLHPRPGDRILDIGGGLGMFSRAMARRTGVPVVAVERSEEQIQEALKLADAEGESGRLDMRQGNAEELPLNAHEWGTFDIVHTRFLLEHVTDPQEVVRQMAKAVRPNGRLVLEDDDHDVLRLYPETEGFPEVWAAYMKSYEVLGADPRIGRRFPELLVNAGIEPVRITCKFYGGFTGDPLFRPHLVNLAEVIDTAREIMIGQLGLSAETLDRVLEAICRFDETPGAALWYAFCWAEGVRR